MSRGRLIAIEGIDGAGKSTQVELLAAELRARGRTVVVTTEPTRGAYGSRIRELSVAGAPLTPEAELEYFIEDRREHVRDLIAPALERGELVLTDRYFLSNVAYQGARGLEPDAVLARNEALFPLPDAAVILELGSEHGLRRVSARGGVLNRAYEQLDFLRRVAEIFAAIDRPYVIRIAGDLPVDAVHQRVMQALGAIIELD